MTAVGWIVGVGALLLVISYCGNWQNRWKYRHIPGPKPSFPLGNLQTALKKQLFRAHQEWQAEYGLIYKFFSARQPIIVVTDPQVVRQISVKDFSTWKDKTIPALDNPLLSGHAQEAARSSMIIAKSPLWGSLRAGAQPLFHTHSLSAYAATINRSVEQLIANLKAAAVEGKEVNIMQQLGQMTLQVTGAAAFGVDLDCQHETSEQEAPLITACRGVFDNALPSKWALLAMLSPAPLLPFIKALSQWLPTTTDTANRKANAYIYDVCVHLMQNASGRRKISTDWLWFSRDPGNPYKDIKPAENSILPLLLKANNKGTGQQLTDLQIASQASLIMLAGYETTAVALTQCIYMLSKHPEAQEKFLQEVDRSKKEVRYEDLGDFPYAAAVLRETLRLQGPSTLYSRIAMKDTHVGPYAVPKGTQVHISSYTMHHDKRWWEDAEIFKPERWVGDETGGDRSGGLAYTPFGVGPRACIGIKFAVEESIIALVRIYRELTFQLADSCPEPLDLKQGITVAPKGGIPVRVLQRHIS